MFEIRLEGKAPIYEQLSGGIAQLILSGQLAPEEKLPAVREVAKHLGVNPNTVQKAYATLEQAGLIYSMPARGSYVASGGGAAEALKADAMKRLEQALEAARRSGVSAGEAADAVSRIWSEDRKEVTE